MASSPQVDNDLPIKEVQIEGLAVLKIIKHCKENLPDLVTGQLLGLDVGSTLEVTNSFPFPRVDDDEQENIGAAYQIDMMRCLREVNVDHNTVGWYQSTYLGSFMNERMIETQFTYQATLSHSVWLVYDPLRTSQGSLSLKAYRLSASFMEHFKNRNFTQEALTKSHLTYGDILEEIPIVIRNSYLVSAFLWEVEGQIDADIHSNGLSRLDLSFSPFLEKNLDFLIEYTDEISTEMNKYQVFQRHVQRQLQQQQALIQKKRSEGVPEEEIESSFKPINQPSRLESLLLTQQIAQFSKQINEFSAQNLGKLFLFSELNSDK